MTRQGVAENGGLWRTMRHEMADFVAIWRVRVGGKWRFLSDYVAENGGFCRNMAR